MSCSRIHEPYTLTWESSIEHLRVFSSPLAFLCFQGNRALCDRRCIIHICIPWAGGPLYIWPPRPIAANSRRVIILLLYVPERRQCLFTRRDHLRPLIFFLGKLSHGVLHRARHGLAYMKRPSFRELIIIYSRAVLLRQTRRHALWLCEHRMNNVCYTHLGLARSLKRRSRKLRFVAIAGRRETCSAYVVLSMCPFHVRCP